jgi:hypothetical protein
MKLSQQLTLLVDELLDAHEDTMRLSAELDLGWRWQAHLCYLRELERLGREALAAATADRPPKTFAPLRRTRPRVRSHYARDAAGQTRQFRSNLPRRGERRCARDGLGEGPT